MADVTAVRVSPTCAVPEMVGLPEGGLLVVGVAAATASVGSLVSVSAWPRSSVNETRSRMV